MELEPMVFARMTGDAGIAALTAVYNNRPAVFYQRAPNANSAKWADAKRQYPRVDYTIETMEEPARNTGGMMIVNVWCDTEHGSEPEAIAARIRALFHATFAQPDSGGPYCFVWSRTDSFEAGGSDGEPYTIGYTMRFDLMAFPSQYTTTPDPIEAINTWTHSTIADAVVIGIDTLDGWITPTQQQPIIYWRVLTQDVHQETHVCTWLNATLECHVFVSDVNARMRILRAICTAAVLVNHVTMEDDSPMFIRNIKINNSANYLTNGQIQAIVRYGILQDWYANPAEKPKLDNVVISQD